MEAMREAIKVIKQADPEFKITLAGNYHPEIQQDLYYLSIPYGNLFPKDVKKEREKKDKSVLFTLAVPKHSLILSPSPNRQKQHGLRYMQWQEDTMDTFVGR